MDETIIPGKTPESKCLTEFVRKRIQKKQGCIMLFTGEPGKGKSYAGLRFFEMWYKDFFNEDFPINHVVNDLEEAIMLVKDFTKKGEGVLVEELSVLAGVRDSLTSQNKLWNKFLDTVRIKQAIIIGNAPHISFIDKHFQMLCQVWVECFGINFRKKIVVCKPLWLQTSQHRKEPYKHKFVDEKGNEVEICYFNKPSEALSLAYDVLKTAYTTKLYEELADKMFTIKMKIFKELGKKVLSPREQQAYDLKLSGLKAEQIREKMGLSDVDTVYQYIKAALNKVNDAKMRQNAKESRKIYEIDAVQPLLN